MTSLMDNLSTQIVLRINDEESAMSLARGLGECTITSRQKALRVMSGQRGGPVNASSGLTQQHQKRLLVDSSWLHKLPPGHAFMRLHGEVYKVQFPLIGTPLSNPSPRSENEAEPVVGVEERVVGEGTPS